MSNIVIREILASDTFSALKDKINYNFDQLLLAGGGPPGIIGGDGDLGPIGLTGTRLFTVIDIVNRTTGTPISAPYLNPNNYYPVATGATYEIGTDSRPLRHGDLFIEEGDSAPGVDGDIWIYSSITNTWTQTGNNIKGSTGTAGDAGVSEWERVSIGASLDHDYLTIAAQTGSTKYGVVLGTVGAIVEGTTVDSTALLTIAMSANPVGYEKIGISLGEQGELATNYSQVKVTSGTLQIYAPLYNTNSINLLADSQIKLTNVAASKYYELNSTYTLGSRLPANSHCLYGMPVNIYMQNSDNLGTVSIYRDSKSAFLIQPSGISSVILSAKTYASNTGPTVDRGNANIALNVAAKKSIAIGAYTGTAADITFNSTLHVNGNATIGTTNETLDPGINSLAVSGYIGAGVDFRLDSTSNEWDSILYAKGKATSDASLTISAQNDRYAAIYLVADDAHLTDYARISYNTHRHNLHLGVANYTDALVIKQDGKVSINSTSYPADNVQLTVNGSLRLLADMSTINNGLEIIKDANAIYDSLRPTRRGITISENNLGLFNFYVNTTQNTLYSHYSDMVPLYNNVNSSRFNFRSYNNTNTLSLLSITGVNEDSLAVQIGTEYNLTSSRIFAVSPETSSFKGTSLHIRKNTSNNSKKLTGVLFQNDDPTSGSGINNHSTDLDFLFTDTTTSINKLNYPQARIRATDNSITSGVEYKMRGSLEFYTAKNVDSIAGNNNLYLALSIDSNQDAIFTSDVTINGTLYTTGTLQFENIILGTTNTLETNYMIGSTGSNIRVKGGDGYVSSQEGKYLGLYGGTAFNEDDKGGDVNIIGGGGNSEAYGYISPTATGKGGDIYIAGGAPVYPISDNIGIVYLGINNLIGLESAVSIRDANYTNALYYADIHLKGYTYINGKLAIGSTSTGITSPDAKLDVTAPMSGFMANFDNTSILSNCNVLYLRSTSSNSNDYLIRGVSGLSSTDRFLVKADGSVGIGTSTFNYSPATPNYMYHTGTSLSFWQELSNVTAKLAVGGSIVCTSISTISDKRAKTNFEEIVKPLERILKLKPLLFNYKTSIGIPEGGFIAQEVEEFIPEAIRIQADENYEGGKYSLHYDTILTFTVAAIQEQQKQIEEKDKKIYELEERLKKIEELLNIK